VVVQELHQAIVIASLSERLQREQNLIRPIPNPRLNAGACRSEKAPAACKSSTALRVDMPMMSAAQATKSSLASG
jgi:hypothetical protein